MAKTGDAVRTDHRSTTITATHTGQTGSQSFEVVVGAPGTVEPLGPGDPEAGEGEAEALCEPEGEGEPDCEPDGVGLADPDGEPLGEADPGDGEADWGDGEADSGDGEADSGGGEPDCGDAVVGSGGGGDCWSEWLKIKIASRIASIPISIISSHDATTETRPARS